MRRVWALVLVGAVVFLTGLGRQAIQDSDEAFYAEAGREMVASGDWVTPHFDFEPRLQKPILYYWMVAASYVATGTSETAARLWSALSGMGLMLVAFGAARRWTNDRTALLAGVVAGTGIGVAPLARQSLPDMPLAFFVSVATWAAFEALAGPALAERPRMRAGSSAAWLYLAGVAAALGFLTKGPIALVLPAASLLPLAFFGWRRKLVTLDFRAVDVAGALGVFLVIALPWYVAVTRAQGVEYLRQFFVGENVDRFATSQYNTWRGYDYIPELVGGLLPWSAFALVGLRAIWRRARAKWFVTSTELALACWAIGPLAFLMASIGSQPRYIAPCLVPFAVLLAMAIGSGHERARDRLFTCAAVLGALALALIGGLAWRATPLFMAADPHWTPVGAQVIVLAGLVAAVSVLVLQRSSVPAALAIATVVSMVAFRASVLTASRPEPVEVAADLVGREQAVRACACGAFARSLVFYSRVPTVVGVTSDDVARFLDTPDHVVAAVDSTLLDEVETERHLHYRRLGELRYLDSGVRQRPDSLVHPDPSQVQRVIVVANR